MVAATNTTDMSVQGGEDNDGFDLPDLQTAQNFLGVDANDQNAHTYVYDQNKSLQGMTVREPNASKSRNLVSQNRYQ